jgi:hypothetical protein
MKSKNVDALLDGYIVGEYNEITQRIEKALPDCENMDVGNFLREIIVYIGVMERRKAIRPTNKEILYEIDRIVKNVNKWIETLNELISHRYYLSDIYGGIDRLAAIRLNQIENATGNVGKNILALQHEAFKARDSLAELLNSLDGFRHEFPIQKAGRPKADESGFVAALALAYTKFIGKPSTYPDGPFAAIVRIALEEVGLPCTDPTRKIEAAISSLDNIEK